MSNNNNAKLAVLASAITIIIIVLIIGGIGYFLFAFDSVDETKYALRKSQFTGRVDEKVYTKGLYHIGLDGYFIKFPSRVRSIEFFAKYEISSNVDTSRLPLDARSSDGLLITIQLAFRYQLQKDQLLNLYRTYGSDYESTFIEQARTTLRDTASHFTAIKFFNARDQIGRNMTEDLQKAFVSMFATIETVNMKETDLPDAFEEALQQVQVAQQQYEIAMYEQEAEIVKAQTEIFKAQANANITILTAEADAEAYLINMKAQADALNITLNTQNMAYYAMGQQLNLTSTELLSLLWIMAIMQHDSSFLIIGDMTPLITIPENYNTTLF